MNISIGVDFTPQDQVINFGKGELVAHIKSFMGDINKRACLAQTTKIAAYNPMSSPINDRVALCVKKILFSSEIKQLFKKIDNDSQDVIVNTEVYRPILELAKIHHQNKYQVELSIKQELETATQTPVETFEFFEYWLYDSKFKNEDA